MKSKLLAHSMGFLLVLLPAATFAEVTPYPPYPGAVPSTSYTVRLDMKMTFTADI